MKKRNCGPVLVSVEQNRKIVVTKTNANKVLRKQNLLDPPCLIYSVFIFHKLCSVVQQMSIEYAQYCLLWFVFHQSSLESLYNLLGTPEIMPNFLICEIYQKDKSFCFWHNEAAEVTFHRSLLNIHSIASSYPHLVLQRMDVWISACVLADYPRKCFAILSISATAIALEHRSMLGS